MTSKERVLTTFEFREPDRVPCWLGASTEFIDLAVRDLGLKNEEDLRRLLGDDFRRVTAPYRFQEHENEDHTPFGIPRAGIGYGMAMDDPLRDAGFEEVEKYPWPDPENVDISEYRKQASEHFNDYAILGGDWSPFWHDWAELLGMENLFIKMYTEPDLVQQVLDRIMDYYITVNTRIFEEAADLIDIFFIGNDFGSNTGPQIDVDLFDKFVTPQLKRLADLGHGYGMKVMLHCCGAFRELIPSMIDAGLDGLHALQPYTRGMDPGELKSEFGDRIVLNGCIDSKTVLIEGNPGYVQQETNRTLDIMAPGGGYIAGASHDWLLEETPLPNVLTMFETIRDYTMD